MTTMLHFLKIHGLGNDFIVTHAADAPAELIAAITRRSVSLCDRQRGVGADGIILITPSATADFKTLIINSDGSVAEMSGNGIRCCAHYLHEAGLSQKKSVAFETGAGPITVERIDDASFRVAMGRPVLDAPLIPTTQPAGRVIRYGLAVDPKVVNVTAVSMGNPHAVIYAESLTDELVRGTGPLIERHPFFPKTNVEFVTVLSRSEIRMRVWERGCGETLACGTGACAAAVAGILNHLNDTAITVHQPGGDLFVEWSGEETDNVYLTGPAAISFQGDIELGA